MSVRAARSTPPPPTSAAPSRGAAGGRPRRGQLVRHAVGENPLTRNIVVSIRASLNDLCLQKAKGQWSPTPEALKSICKRRRLNYCPPAQRLAHTRSLPCPRSPGEEVRHPRRRAGDARRPQGMFRSNSNPFSPAPHSVVYRPPPTEQSVVLHSMKYAPTSPRCPRPAPSSRHCAIP